MKEIFDLETSVLTTKPKDFDERWNKWLKEVHDVKNNIEIVKVEEEGFGKKIFFYYDSVKDTKIYACAYIRNDKFGPVIAYYHGHNSWIEHEHNNWHALNLVDMGYNVVMCDMRFQGDKVKDPNTYRFTEYPSACFNIDDLENCYNKRLNQDALKLIDIIESGLILPGLDSKGIWVAGPSQGGGLSMMVAALRNDVIKGSLSDLPSDCALKDRIIGSYGKYGVIKNFLNDHQDLTEVVMNNQDYFDVINMADKIKCPIITSIGTVDVTCPPRFFYQAYKQITSHKELYTYEGYGHGGFEEKHLPLKKHFLKRFAEKIDLYN